MKSRFRITIALMLVMFAYANLSACTPTTSSLEREVQALVKELRATGAGTEAEAERLKKKAERLLERIEKADLDPGEVLQLTGVLLSALMKQ